MTFNRAVVKMVSSNISEQVVAAAIPRAQRRWLSARSAATLARRPHPGGSFQYTQICAFTSGENTEAESDIVVAEAPDRPFHRVRISRCLSLWEDACRAEASRACRYRSRSWDR